MAPSSILNAVTVAPATGSFAELVTIPTIVPNDVLCIAAGDSSAAWTAAKANPAIKAVIAKRFEHFLRAIDLILFNRNADPQKAIDRWNH
jgi:hypothetical protein